MEDGANGEQVTLKEKPVWRIYTFISKTFILHPESYRSVICLKYDAWMRFRKALRGIALLGPGPDRENAGWTAPQQEQPRECRPFGHGQQEKGQDRGTDEEGGNCVFEVRYFK